LWRIGIGVGVLAIAQTYRVLSGTALSEPNLPFAALRLLGLVIILIAVVGFYRHVLALARSGRLRQQEDLRIAAVRLEQAGEHAAKPRPRAAQRAQWPGRCRGTARRRHRRRR
jgi:hypothetical protein